MSNQRKYYTVEAGRKEPVKVLSGTLNKESGQPNSDTQVVGLAVGKILLPNHSFVWGRRIIESDDTKKSDNKTQARSVAVTDPKYKGKIEFLPWNDDKGEQIAIRYIRKSSSLDAQYQDLVEKLKPADDEAFIELENGLNHFDEKQNPLLVEMIKRHTLNISNTSRDPNNYEFAYKEYSPTERTKAKEAMIVDRSSATDIVIESKGSSSRIQTLGLIFRLDSMMPDDMLYETLLDKAENNPVEFMSTIQSVKASVFVAFRDAEEAGLIDLKVKDKIHYNPDGKRAILLNEVEADEEDKIKWVTENILESAVYQAYTTLKAALKQYQTQLQ